MIRELSSSERRRRAGISCESEEGNGLGFAVLAKLKIRSLEIRNWLVSGVGSSDVKGN